MQEASLLTRNTLKIKAHFSHSSVFRILAKVIQNMPKLTFRTEYVPASWRANFPNEITVSNYQEKFSMQTKHLLERKVTKVKLLSRVVKLVRWAWLFCHCIEGGIGKFVRVEAPAQTPVHGSSPPRSVNPRQTHITRLAPSLLVWK